MNWCREPLKIKTISNILLLQFWLQSSINFIYNCCLDKFISSRRLHLDGVSCFYGTVFIPAIELDLILIVFWVGCYLLLRKFCLLLLWGVMYMDGLCGNFDSYPINISVFDKSCYLCVFINYNIVIYWWFLHLRGFNVFLFVFHQFDSSKYPLIL